MKKTLAFAFAAIALSAMSSVANAGATCGGADWTSENFFAGKCTGAGASESDNIVKQGAVGTKGTFNAITASNESLKGSFDGNTSAAGAGLQGKL